VIKILWCDDVMTENILGTVGVGTAPAKKKHWSDYDRIRVDAWCRLSVTWWYWSKQHRRYGSLLTEKMHKKWINI
jgi:hypothetical protein